MKTILIATLLLIDILKWIILIDVILSWLIIFWIKLRPKFIANIIDPIYKKIKKIIPTTFWSFEFVPIIVLIILILFQQLVYIYDVELMWYYIDLLNF
jgi:YggT family protein